MRLLLSVALCSLVLHSCPTLAAEAKDAEPTVNTAPQIASLSVLLVSDGNFSLEEALKSLGLKQLVQVKPAEFEQGAPDKADARDGRPFDVILFDRHRPTRPPRARGVMFFAELPPDANLPVVSDPDKPDQPARIDTVRADKWDDRHPALANVQVRRMFIRDGIRIDAAKLPVEWNVVIGCNQGPLVLERRRKATEIEPGQNQMVVTFPLDQTNWTIRPSFPIFISNVIPFLAAEPVVEKKR